jgi:hypothetical protein
VLLSPVFPEPFEGKDTVVKILSGLLETIDSIKVIRASADLSRHRRRIGPYG